MKKFKDVIVTISFIVVLIMTVVYFVYALYEGIGEMDSLSIEGYDLFWYQLCIGILLIRYPAKEKIQNVIKFLKNEATKQNKTNNGKKNQKVTNKA